MLELVELNEASKERSAEFQGWNSLPSSEYVNAQKLAFGLLSVFGSTCEQLFSSIKFVKSKYGSRLSDENLQALLDLLRLKCSKYTANLSKLAEKTQTHKSH